MRMITLLFTVLLALAWTAGPARADSGGSPNANADYGQHVAEHAREAHLGKDMNPGMHQGKSGWEPGHAH